MFQGKTNLVMGILLACSMSAAASGDEGSAVQKPLAAINGPASPMPPSPNLESATKPHAPNSVTSEAGSSLTSNERDMLSQQSLIEQQTRLWKAKADQAKAMADYQKAVDEYNKASGDNAPASPAAKPDSAMLQQRQAMEAFNAQIAAKQAERVAITLVGVYGQPGHLSADVSYAGSIMRVKPKERVGDWLIERIEPTQIIAYRKGKKSVITLSGGSGDGGNMGPQPIVSGSGPSFAMGQ